MFDTMDFAESFERVGFETDKARVLASAFAKAHVLNREDVVTKPYLDARLAEMEGRLNKTLNDGIDRINGRLWAVLGTLGIVAGMIGGALAKFA